MGGRATARRARFARALALACLSAAATALKVPGLELNKTRGAADVKAALSNWKAAAASTLNATLLKDGGAALRTLPARTGVGMLPAARLSTLRVPKEGLDALALGSDLAAPPLKECGAGLGLCGPGLCCSAAGFCARDPYSCDGTCQRTYSGMDAPCNGAYPDPVPKWNMTQAVPGGVCGVYVGTYCPAGECCTQFGFCAPTRLGGATNGTGALKADTAPNFWCGIGSCVLPSSPFSPECAAAHALLAPKVRKFKLTFERGTVNPDGVDKVAILVNKQFPGPTLTVDLGDQVVIELHNHLDDVSLLHVHGMLQIGSPGQDGVQWVTQNPAPGALQTEGLPQPDSDPNAPPSYMYSFIASVPGTFWYHSHYDVQYADGARGAFIVKAPPSLAQVEEAARAAKGEATGLPPPPPPPPGRPPGPAFKEPLAYEVDAPVLLFDNYHTPYDQLEDIYASATLNPEGVEPVPNSVLINGIGQGYCGGNTLNGTVSGAGQPPCNWALIKAVASPCSAPKTRLRLINGGAFAPVDVFIDGVSVFVVEIDAVRVNPVLVPGPVRVNIGQRVAVAICVDGEVPDSVLMRVAMDQTAFFEPSAAPVSSAVVHFGKALWGGVVPRAAPWLPLPRAVLQQQVLQQATDAFGPIGFNQGMAPPPANKQLTLAISTGTLDGENIFTVNDVSFQPPDTPSFLSRQLGNPGGVGVPPIPAAGQAGFNFQNFDLGDVVDVFIDNYDTGQHPIHLHGSWFTVMAVGAEGDGPYAGQALAPLVVRDTSTVPASSYMVLRVPVFNRMPQMLHCHIEPHLGIGLAFLMNSGLPA